jgi:MYXO-CTERM domain-containing protein
VLPPITYPDEPSPSNGFPMPRSSSHDGGGCSMTNEPAPLPWLFGILLGAAGLRLRRPPRH